MTEQASNPILAALLAAYKPPIELFSVSDRGVPGQERVNLRANIRVDLRDYLLLAGVHLPNNRAVPIPNHMLWLGEHSVDSGSWIIVYTGPGEPALMTQTRDTKEPLLVLHWGLNYTLFQEATVVPVLIKIDLGATQIGKPDFSHQSQKPSSQR